MKYLILVLLVGCGVAPTPDVNSVFLGGWHGSVFTSDDQAGNTQSITSTPIDVQIERLDGALQIAGWCNVPLNVTEDHFLVSGAQKCVDSEESKTCVYTYNFEAGGVGSVHDGVLQLSFKTDQRSDCADGKDESSSFDRFTTSYTLTR